jgi:predicted O-methyltransferase YrrM
MTVPGFTEDWFGPASCEALANLAHAVRDLPGAIVEIGAWEGRSTIALANAARPRQVVSVDTWAGSPGEVSADLAADRDVFAQWQSNVATFTAGNVRPVRMGWREFLAGHTEPIALAFIDAEHTRKEVAGNIAALLPLMAPGGIICGDDAHHPPVQEGVGDALPAGEVFVVATLWIWQKPVKPAWKIDKADELATKYMELCKTPSDIYLHLPTFVQIVDGLHAQHVIELGTRTGVSTIAWLHALRGTGGRLTSVDIDTRPDIGEYDHWTFIQGDDQSPEVLAQLEPADVVFLDTSHLWPVTLHELETYLPLVKSGGFIVCHDTELQFPEGTQRGDPPYPVKKAITEFTAKHGLQWQNVTECWGLGLIKIP